MDGPTRTHRRPPHVPRLGMLESVKFSNQRWSLTRLLTTRLLASETSHRWVDQELNRDQPNTYSYLRNVRVRVRVQYVRLYQYSCSIWILGLHVEAHYCIAGRVTCSRKKATTTPLQDANHPVKPTKDIPGEYLTVPTSSNARSERPSILICTGTAR